LATWQNDFVVARPFQRPALEAHVNARVRIQVIRILGGVAEGAAVARIVELNGDLAIAVRARDAGVVAAVGVPDRQLVAPDDVESLDNKTSDGRVSVEHSSRAL